MVFMKFEHFLNISEVHFSNLGDFETFEDFKFFSSAQRLECVNPLLRA